MAGDRIEPVDGAAAGAWILPALNGDWGGQVKNLVPQIYEAYARIFHPAQDEEGNPVTWAEVASRLGTIAHPEMQWHAIVGSYDPTNFTDKRWPGGDPGRGELDDEDLDVLCRFLADHTGTPDSVYFGMSTIHSGVIEEWPDAPQHEQTHRQWVILKGPLAAVDQITLSSRHGFSFVFYSAGHGPPPDEPAERSLREAPSLIWPEDRAWFVASEVDFDSTLVGGSRALIDALLAASELEALEVDDEVSLTADADKLNPVPDPPPGWDDPVAQRRTMVLGLLGTLSGEVRSATSAEGVLAIEVIHANGLPWLLLVEHSEWSPEDPSELAGRAVETVELTEADGLRLRLADGPPFELRPLPSVDARTSWRFELADGMVVAHGPELRVEYPDR
jgi:hypothetical protein